MNITEELKERIKSNSTTIFEHYGTIAKKRCKSPCHDDHNPSCSVDVKKGVWYCHVCNKGGDIFDFVAEKENIDIRANFVEVVKICADICNLPLTDNGKCNDNGKCKQPLATAEPIPPRYLTNEANTMERDHLNNALYKYLCTIFAPCDVKQVMQMYHVGRGYFLDCNNDWQMSDKPMILQGTAETTAFPFVDVVGNVHGIKVIPYNRNDGHRIKGKGAEMHYYKPHGNKGAYFGTHLLNDRTNAPIALVESEKSAIIGALFAPNYIWIAVGGKGNLDPKDNPRLEPLRGRVIYVYPDADAVEQWRTHVEQMRTNGYNVIYREDIIGQFPPESKIDIADIILAVVKGGR